MDINEIHSDYRATVKRLPPTRFDSWFWQPVLRFLYPILFATKVADGVQTRDLKIGPVKLRVYIPEEKSGAGMLWVHGGGMIVGDEKQDNNFCSAFARELGLVVVSVGYRLAPKHAFPAAGDDCFAAWQWFVKNARDYGVDPTRILVAAESGGGSHGASLVHRIHDHGGIQPAGQALFEPMLDDRTAADPTLDDGHYIWRWQDNRAGWRAWLGHEPGQDSEPDYAVPARRADLSGLPPTWLGVGNKDLFYAEGRRYAERLEAAGVEVEFVEVDGAPHGFHMLVLDAPTRLSFMEKNHTWIARVLGISRAARAQGAS